MVRQPVSRRWVGVVVMFGLTMFGLTISGGTMAAGGRPQKMSGKAGAKVGPREAAQVTRNDRADVTFEVRPSATGAGISVVARSNDLQVTKTVQATGDFVLEIGAGPDRVTVAASSLGATVTRGKASVALRRSEASDEAATKIRRLLADSDAIVKYRAVAARLIDEQDRSHAALALILGDATVGMLTGDVGAPGRIARLLAERRNRNLRQAGMAVDCFTVMETRMVEAWGDFGSCYYSTAYNSFYQYLCSWRWTIQVESYWFNFLSCTGLDIS